MHFMKNISDVKRTTCESSMGACCSSCFLGTKSQTLLSKGTKFKSVIKSEV